MQVLFSVCCDTKFSYIILLMNKNKNYCWRLSHDIRKFPLMTGLAIRVQGKRKLHDWLLRICALSYMHRGTARQAACLQHCCVCCRTSITNRIAVSSFSACCLHSNISAPEQSGAVSYRSSPTYNCSFTARLMSTY